MPQLDAVTFVHFVCCGRSSRNLYGDRWL